MKRPAGYELIETPNAKKPDEKPIDLGDKSGDKKLAMTRKCITCRAYRDALRDAGREGKAKTAALAAASVAYAAAGEKLDKGEWICCTGCMCCNFAL